MNLRYYLVPHIHRYFYPYEQLVANRCPYNGEQASPPDPSSDVVDDDAGHCLQDEQNDD
jgi:hypothetical protein